MVIYLKDKICNLFTKRINILYLFETFPKWDSSGLFSLTQGILRI